MGIAARMRRGEAVRLGARSCLRAAVQCCSVIVRGEEVHDDVGMVVGGGG